MNIPKKEGTYRLNLGQNTIKIDIHNEAVRLNKLDKLVSGSKNMFGGYRNEPKYDVKVLDTDGNVIDSKSTFNIEDYESFVSSLVAKENNITANPKEIENKLYLKIQKDFGALVTKSNFNGFVKNNMKMTFYVDNWNADKGYFYDSQELVDFFEKMGLICKVAPKKKEIRASTCWVVSVFVPLDYNLNETRNMKKVFRITEQELHNIVKDAVKSVLNEYNYKRPERKILKSVNAKGINIIAYFEEGDDTMWVEWNGENDPITYTRTEWLRHVKDNLYSTYTNWDELDFALKALGVKKVGEKNHISDWGDGDTDTFTNSLYDFSSVF